MHVPCPLLACKFKRIAFSFFPVAFLDRQQASMSNFVASSVELSNQMSAKLSQAWCLDGVVIPTSTSEDFYHFIAASCSDGRVWQSTMLE